MTPFPVYLGSSAVGTSGPRRWSLLRGMAVRGLARLALAF